MSITLSIADDIATITLDDGRANAIDPAWLDDFLEKFTEAEKGAKAIVIAGRDGGLIRLGQIAEVLAVYLRQRANWSFVSMAASVRWSPLVPATPSRWAYSCYCAATRGSALGANSNSVPMKP